MRQAAISATALLLAALLSGSTAAATPNGRALYTANCAGCHQATGQGLPGAFPPLAGHVGEVLAARGGRGYLQNVVLYGLQGPITVKGTTYNGVMPAFGQLKDAELAAILNYVSTSLGNKRPSGQKPVTAAELAATRKAKKTPAQVAGLRPRGLR